MQKVPKLKKTQSSFPCPQNPTTTECQMNSV